MQGSTAWFASPFLVYHLQLGDLELLGMGKIAGLPSSPSPPQSRHQIRDTGNGSGIHSGSTLMIEAFILRQPAGNAPKVERDAQRLGVGGIHERAFQRRRKDPVANKSERQPQTAESRQDSSDMAAELEFSVSPVSRPTLLNWFVSSSRWAKGVGKLRVEAPDPIIIRGTCYVY